MALNHSRALVKLNIDFSILINTCSSLNLITILTATLEAFPSNISILSWNSPCTTSGYSLNRSGITFPDVPIWNSFNIFRREENFKSSSIYSRFSSNLNMGLSVIALTSSGSSERHFTSSEIWPIGKESEWTRTVLNSFFMINLFFFKAWYFPRMFILRCKSGWKGVSLSFFINVKIFLAQSLYTQLQYWYTSDTNPFPSAWKDLLMCTFPDLFGLFSIFCKYDRFQSYSFPKEVSNPFSKYSSASFILLLSVRKLNRKQKSYPRDSPNAASSATSSTLSR